MWIFHFKKYFSATEWIPITEISASKLEKSHRNFSSQISKARNPPREK